MRICVSTVCAVVLFLLPALPLQAASLQVAPVSIEVQAPSATAMLKLRNEGTAPLNAQIRVFRWTQVNGEEKLEPTDDLVASPPMASLTPKTDYLVRLVRLSKTPVSGSESYRLLVDELPEPSNQRNRTVNVVVRYSIPVFFYAAAAAPAKLAWFVDQRRGRIQVSATNAGDRHARIAGLGVSDASGKTMSFGNGLTGYALGRSTMRWTMPAGAGRGSIGQPVGITAHGDQGPIHALPSAPSAR